MMVEARLDHKDQQHTCLFPTRYSFSNLRSPRCARDHKIPSLRLLAYRVGAKRQEQLGLPSGEAGSCRATDRRLMRVFPHRKSLQPLSFYKGCACARKAGYGDLPLTLSHRAIIAIIAINATFFNGAEGRIDCKSN